MQSNQTDEKNFKTHQDEIVFLKSLGFLTNPDNKKLSSLKEVWDFSDSLYKNKENLAYQIDGLVVKLNRNDLVNKADVVGKTPRAWCAIKFPADEVTTKIKNITWQVGRTGKITPVAELEAVSLAGSVVRRAALHNYKEVLERDYHYFDTIVIRKAGDIIPEVVEILKNLREEDSKKLTIINNCPSCDTSLKFSETGIDLICPNREKCHEQIVLRLSYFASKQISNIDGLSKKNIQRLVQEFGIFDIPDLYKLDYNKTSVLEGFGSKSVENLQQSIQISRKIPAHKFLAGLGVDGFGLEVSRLIADKMLHKKFDKR